MEIRRATSLPVLPKVKRAFDLLYLDGRVRLGSGPAFDREVEDPDGRWAALLRLLDGTRRIDALTEELTGRMGRAEIEEGLGVLRDEGIIEDADEPLPAPLTEADRLRYRVNLNHFATLSDQYGDERHIQARLKSTRVLVLGMGGIGTNLVFALAELGVGHIIGVDFDRVEVSNLNRQVLYSTTTIGQRKVDVAKTRINEFNPDIRFDVSDRKLWSEAAVRETVVDAAPDIVFCLADKPNFLIDHWVNDTCLDLRIPCIAGAVSGNIGIAYTVEPFVAACYRCRTTQEAEQNPDILTYLDYIFENELNCENAALGPACMFISYYLSYEFMRMRLGLSAPLTRDKLYEIDLLAFEGRYHDFGRIESCPSCGSGRAAGEAPVEAAHAG